MSLLNRLRKLNTVRGIYYDEKRDKTVITLSSSLIKDLTHKNSFRTICPSYLYFHSVMRAGADNPTDSMKRGLYFESRVLGSTSKGNFFPDFERKRGGEKYAWHERIDLQIERFSAIAEKHELMINPVIDGKPIQNTQVHFEFELDFPELNEKYPDYVFIMMMEVDLISPVKNQYGQFESAIIDLKLTQDINTTFGEFAWGNAEEMDHIQGLLYSFFIKLPFFYLVFDYSKTLNYDFYQVITDLNSEWEYVRSEAQIRYREMKQRIFDVADYLVDFHENSYWYIKIPTHCKRCQLIKYCNTGKQFNLL